MTSLSLRVVSQFKPSRNYNWLKNLLCVAAAFVKCMARQSSHAWKRNSNHKSIDIRNRMWWMSYDTYLTYVWSWMMTGVWLKFVLCTFIDGFNWQCGSETKCKTGHSCLNKSQNRHKWQSRPEHNNSNQKREQQQQDKIGKAVKARANKSSAHSQLQLTKVNYTNSKMS